MDDYHPTPVIALVIDLCVDHPTEHPYYTINSYLTLTVA